MQVLSLSDPDRDGKFAPLKPVTRPNYAFLASEEDAADVFTKAKNEQCDSEWYLADVFTS